MNSTFLKFPKTIFKLLVLTLLLPTVGAFAQVVVDSSPPRDDRPAAGFLGIKLRPEIQAIVKEIERSFDSRDIVENVRQFVKDLLPNEFSATDLH